MELRQLIYFRAAARTQSFTAAARECFVTPASLSQQIKQLENELGTSLFIRNNNVLTITESGKIFYQDAEKILRDVAEAMTHMENTQITKQFRLGFYGHPFGSHFPALLAGFHQKHPHVEIYLTEDTMEKITDLLLQNRLDGIVSALDGILHRKELFVRELLWESEYVLVLPKGIFPPGTPVSLKDPLPLPLITLSNTMQRQINQKMATDRLDVVGDVGRRGNTHQTMELLIASGQCAALMPSILAENTEYQEVHPLEGNMLRYQSYFFRRKESVNEPCLQFVEYCREFLRLESQ